MEVRVFRSKLGPGLAVFVYGLMGALSVYAVWEKHWMVLFFLLLQTAVITHILMSIRYIITDGILLIRVSFFYRLRIDIGSVTKITKSRNPLSSPAASLDRLEVHYGKYDSILISPKDKRGFAETLVSINPSIEVHI